MAVDLRLAAFNEALAIVAVRHHRKAYLVSTEFHRDHMADYAHVSAYHFGIPDRVGECFAAKEGCAGCGGSDCREMPPLLAHRDAILEGSA